MILDRILAVINSCSDVIHIVDSIQQGSILLQSGKHVIEVKTRKPPVDIALSLIESAGMPVCNGDIDKMGYTMLPNGFVLYADIVSDTAQIEWTALFEIEGNKA